MGLSFIGQNAINRADVASLEFSLYKRKPSMSDAIMQILNFLDFGTIEKVVNFRTTGLFFVLGNLLLCFFLRVLAGEGADIGFFKRLPLYPNFFCPRNNMEVWFITKFYFFVVIVFPCLSIAFLKA